MTMIDMERALDTLDLLILARMLKGGTVASARKDVGQLAAAQLSPGEWSATFEAHWSRLVEAKLIGLPPGKQRGQTLTVTDAGRRKALAFLRVAELPAKLTWATLLADYLLPVALGIQPQSPESRRLKTAAQLKLAVISRCRHLSLREGASAKSVLAALAWKLIGVDSDADFTAENVIQQLSLGKQSTKKVTTTQMTTALAALALGTSKAALADLRLGAIRQWLHARPLNDKLMSNDGLEAFANRVIDAARHCPPNGRFGENKVFISHVWRQLSNDSSAARLDLGAFKQRLIAANRNGLLHLSRADLVEAMDPTDVRESATEYDNATFHFVRM